MADLELRAITEDEFAAYCHMSEGVFGEEPDEALISDYRSINELDRCLATFAGARVVGTAASAPFQLTLPGGGILPAAGVTAVGVATDHRRRGLLRRMMEEQLADVRSRGEVVAVLTASETSIYGRFGYGLATTQQRVEIERAHAGLRQPADVGGVRLVDVDEARRIVPPIFDAFRRAQPGDLNRTAARWELWFRDRPDKRDGAGPRQWAILDGDGDGRVQGYVSYRMRPDLGSGLPRGIVEASEFVGLSPDANRVLLSYLAGVDLMETVRLSNRPVEDPLRWLLADPRRYQPTLVADWLWVRLIDIPTALSARTYGTPGEIVLEVEDRFLSEVSGTYVLSATEGTATCERTSRASDLRLGVEDLGSIFLGGVRPSTLARAGRIDGDRRALALADAMFVSTPPPYCQTPF